MQRTIKKALGNFGGVIQKLPPVKFLGRSPVSPVLRRGARVTGKLIRKGTKYPLLLVDKIKFKMTLDGAKLRSRHSNQENQYKLRSPSQALESYFGSKVHNIPPNDVTTAEQLFGE